MSPAGERDGSEGRDARDEAALSARETEVRTLVENTPDLIVRWDRELRRVFANRAFAEAAGQPLDVAVGRRFGDGAGPEARVAHAAAEEALERVFATGQPETVEHTLHSVVLGPRIVELRLVPERDARGEIATVLGIGRDVTLQREAEAARRESELRLRQVTEAIDEVFWLTSADKREFIYVSPAYERLFGRPAASLHADPRSWQEVVHPDDLLRVQQAIAAQVSGSYDIEYRIHRGGEVRWIRDRAFPIRDDAGQVHRIAGVAEDITQRKRLEEQLLHAQKMEAIGQLAGGVAHDFNNMLSVIQLQAIMLLNDLAALPRSEALREGVNEILGASERAANLTRQLLTFGRRQVVLARDLDLGEVFTQTLRLLRGVLGERIAIEVRFEGELPRVHADPGMMEQVLVNLAINARDAMPEGGRLRVGLGRAPEGPPADAVGATVTPGAGAGWLELSVADSGHGIDAGLLPRIFEPFFTTKPQGKGTGLGLATVFAIVAQHGGQIAVSSEVGRGTAMNVYLPTLGP